MFVNKKQLIKIKEQAIRSYVDNAKDPSESCDIFLSRCWIEAVSTILNLDLTIERNQVIVHEPNDDRIS